MKPILKYFIKNSCSEMYLGALSNYEINNLFVLGHYISKGGPILCSFHSDNDVDNNEPSNDNTTMAVSFIGKNDIVYDNKRHLSIAERHLSIADGIVILSNIINKRSINIYGNKIYGNKIYGDVIIDTISFDPTWIINFPLIDGNDDELFLAYLRNNGFGEEDIITFTPEKLHERMESVNNYSTRCSVRSIANILDISDEIYVKYDSKLTLTPNKSTGNNIDIDIPIL